MRLFLLCISTLLFEILHAQIFLNLDFESAAVSSSSPAKWYAGGDGYLARLDSSIVRTGKYSLKIRSLNPDKEQFGVCSGTFPWKIAAGKDILFKGWVKTENIGDGFAGLWWRVDGADEVLGFDNMHDRGLRQDADWTELSIAMHVDMDVTNINFGGLLIGTGTAWFDGFEISIDGTRWIDPDPTQGTVTGAEKSALEHALIPLTGCDPESDQADLKPLGELIGDASVVALGEVSHGSSEIFRMKDRIVRYLVEHHGFDIFSIEGNMPEAYRMNQYVVEGQGDPGKYLEGMYFWTWQTEEVLAMTQWMHDHNQHSEHSLLFTGFDMQYYQQAFSEILELLPDDQLDVLRDLWPELEEVRTQEPTAYTHSLTKDQEVYFQKQLKRIRQTIRETHLPQEDEAWALQNVRVIEQYLDRTPYRRDGYMAENLLWIKAQNPEAKIIAWAHNGHIKQSDWSMGRYLDKALKEDYVSIGFMFYEGNYTAKGNNGLTSYQAQTAYPGTYEHVFHTTGVPVFALDLRRIPLGNPDFSWLWQDLSARSVGAVKQEQEFHPTALIDDFDIVIFIDISTASKLLR